MKKSFTLWEYVYFIYSIINTKVMRCILVLMLVTIFQAHAENSYSQNARLSMELNEVTVQNVLDEIESQSEFFFLFNRKLVDVNRKIGISIENQDINETLALVFQGVDVDYIVIDRQIVLSTSDHLSKTKSILQPRTITGTIVDPDGEPLIGVSISIKGTSVGTISNAEGKYSLSGIPDDATLVFSFIGMLTQEIAAGNQTSVNVTMESDVFGLEEIVVTGYGTQKKVNLTGAVDVISSQLIKSRPAGNIVKALQGVSPNLNIYTNKTGGEMGATMEMNIRGYGSINGKDNLPGGSPYILVDGIEQDLNHVNPDDVESISVLKDAAASAIYGARAAFGVILVTTKKGRTDGVSVTYSNQFSFAKALHMPSVVNSLDWAAYHNEGAKNDGQGEYAVFNQETIDKMIQYQAGEIPPNEWTGPDPNNPVKWLGYYYAWGNNNWYETVYRPWVSSPTHNVSISGGNERSQFYISASTMDQQGLLRIGDDTYKKRFLNTRINTKVNEWMRFNFFSKLTGIVLGRPSYSQGSLYTNVARFWPTQHPYDPDGSMSDRGAQIWLDQGGRYNEKTNEFIITPGIEIEPVKGWVIYGNYRLKLNTKGNTNHEAKVAGTNVIGDPYIRRKNNNISSYMYEQYYNSPNLYSTFTKTLGSHNFVVTAGYEQELLTYHSTEAKKHDLITDNVPSINTATGNEYAYGNEGHWSTRSYFGRISYNYLEKYLLEVSARRDGSSRFAEDYRWGTFSSASAGYVISKEQFWEPIKQYVNLLKIRGSYGALGNQNVDNYLYLDRLPINTNLEYIFGNARPVYSGMAGLTSPGITWEKVRTFNIGCLIEVNFRIISIRIFRGPVIQVFLKTSRIPLSVCSSPKIKSRQS